MMQFNSSNGNSFTLTIVNYEFPNNRDNYWDSNWLQILIEGRHSQGFWKALDPCLLTFEVERLAKWLEDVYYGKKNLAECSFMEPCLEFLIELKRDKSKILHIYFELEILPTWAESQGAGLRSFGIEFPISEIDLLRAAKNFVWI